MLQDLDHALRQLNKALEALSDAGERFPVAAT